MIDLKTVARFTFYVCQPNKFIKRFIRLAGEWGQTDAW